MTWLALSLQSRRRNASLADDYLSSDSDSGKEDYSSSDSDSGEEDGSDGDEIVSQLTPIRSAPTTRRALAGNALFNYGINIGLDNEGDDDNEEEDEGDGDIQDETDDITVEDELGSDELDGDEEHEDDNDEEKYLKSLTNKVLQDKLRERGLKVSGRKSILINRLMGREETAEIRRKSER